MSTFKRFCPKGHDKDIVGRTSHRQCNQCAIELKKEWQQDNVEFLKELNKKYRVDHVEYFQQKHKEYYEAHKEEIKQWQMDHIETIKENQKLWNEKNPDYQKLYQREYRKQHPEIVKLLNLQNHVKRKLRIPKWGQDGILEFYINCPKTLVIDHIIPLLGKLVSGLHVDYNLQYMTRHDNAIKHNKVDLNKVSERYGKILEEAGLK